jgi:hypothetical protein
MNVQTKRADYYDANERSNETILSEGGESYASDQAGQNGFYRTGFYTKPLALAIKIDRFVQAVMPTPKFGNVLSIFALKLVYGLSVGARLGARRVPNAKIRIYKTEKRRQLICVLSNRAQ